MSHKKPHALRMQHGTARADRVYGSEPARLTPVKLRLPTYLKGNEFAREFWRKIVRPLNDQDILVGSDLAVMETLATQYADMREAVAEAAGYPSVVVYSNGNPGAHPARSRADQLVAKFVRSLQAAGLTPAQHSKLEVSVSSEVVDEMDAFLDGVG